MKSISFDANIPKYVVTKLLGAINRDFYYRLSPCLSLKNIDEPELPDESWVKLRTVYGGICGSDLNLIFLKNSPATSPFVSFPFALGHEAVGEVVQIGNKVSDFNKGDRIVLNPLLDCKTRGIDAVCKSCANERYSQCENFANGTLSSGISTGFCKDTGGSWSEYFVAHSNQLYKLPDSISDGKAILIEPFASAIHAVINNLPDSNEKILVMGCGVIGLLLVAALRCLGIKSEITVLARHEYQGRVAEEFGADNVIYDSTSNYFEALSKLVGSKIYKPIMGRNIMLGGFDKVFDCVGSERSISDSIWLTKSNGNLIIVGGASVQKNFDLTPVWFKEINISGSFYYGNENYNNHKKSTFEIAVEFMKKSDINFEKLLTHVFDINDYIRAIEAATYKSKYQSLKVCFRFNK